MAYQLTAGTDEFYPETFWTNLVVIIKYRLPARIAIKTFVAWMKGASIGPNGTADPFCHGAQCPMGISALMENHYLIDFNRDAFALTQVETQAVGQGAASLENRRSGLIIMVSLMSITFAPFCTPMNRNYPDELRTWATELGKKMCPEFLTVWDGPMPGMKTYDLFSIPVYWDSYPAFNGAVFRYL